MNRLTHFKSNVGWADVIKTALIGALSVAFAIMNPEPPYSSLAICLALLVPALLRKVLAGNPEFWSALIAKGALLLMVVAFSLSFVKEKLEGTSGVGTAIFSMLALYCSAFFWLWSDPNVVRVEKS